jgi:starch synthase
LVSSSRWCRRGSMDVLMVAAELGPHARATAAADSIGALAKAVRQLGHNVILALPKTPDFDASGLLLARRLSPRVLGAGLEVTVFDGQLASGVGLVLFDAPPFAPVRPIFGAPGSPESEADAGRFALFARAAAAYVRERRELKKPLDVVHLHDWPAAPIAALLKGDGAPPCVLTIHALDAEPTFDREAASLLAPAIDDPRVQSNGKVSYLRVGMLAARTVTTVSPRYAEFLEKGPLSAIAPDLAEPIVGVLDGIDYAIFNPATDPALDSRYDAEDASNKGRCKTALLRARELLLEPERPLVTAYVAGVEPRRQRLMLEALTRLLDQDIAVIVVGGLDVQIAAALDRLRSDSPGDIALMPAVEGTEFRRLIAASDFFLSARGGVPCGHLELVAQRYGALPIAEASGGIPDVVVDVDAELVTGTGFLYEPDSEDALVGAVERALSAYGHPQFARLRRRLMRRDVGWDRPARRYAQIYRRGLGEPSLAK